MPNAPVDFQTAIDSLRNDVDAMEVSLNQNVQNFDTVKKRVSQLSEAFSGIPKKRKNDV